MYISADLIILGFIAGVILFRLYTILGRKDDDGAIIKFNQEKDLNNLVDISANVKTEEINNFMVIENDLAQGFENIVSEIKKNDPSFSLHKFYNGANKAFEMILIAFAENDKATLKNLLNDEVYNQFSLEIESRIKKSVKLDLTLVALPLVKIKDIRIEGNKVSIIMIYNSQQIAIIKNKEGEIIDGSNSQIDNVEDIWTFSKILNSKENWILVDVNAG